MDVARCRPPTRQAAKLDSWVGAVGPWFGSIVMNRRQLLSLSGPMGSAIGSCLSEIKAAIADPYPFSAAYFDGPAGSTKRLFLFPLEGKALSVPLPPLPLDFGLLAYSPDGKALYGKTIFPDSAKGLIKVEFDPIRTSIVPGSADFGIQGLTIPLQLDRIFLEGWHSSGGNQYGIFELNPRTGASKTVLLHPDAFSGKVTSLDRRRRWAELLNPNDGTIMALGDGLKAGAWSPNGKWIAARLDTGEGEKIVLIDGSNVSRRRTLASTEDGIFHWSPDSKYLLISRSELLCGPFTMYGSLQTLDIETGKRKRIASSHCRILTNTTGWLDNRIVSGR